MPSDIVDIVGIVNLIGIEIFIIEGGFDIVIVVDLPDDIVIVIVIHCPVIFIYSLIVIVILLVMEGIPLIDKSHCYWSLLKFIQSHCIVIVIIGIDCYCRLLMIRFNRKRHWLTDDSHSVTLCWSWPLMWLFHCFIRCWCWPVIFIDPIRLTLRPSLLFGCWLIPDIVIVDKLHWSGDIRYWRWHSVFDPFVVVVVGDPIPYRYSLMLLLMLLMTLSIPFDAGDHCCWCLTSIPIDWLVTDSLLLLLLMLVTFVVDDHSMISDVVGYGECCWWVLISIPFDPHIQWYLLVLLIIPIYVVVDGDWPSYHCCWWWRLLLFDWWRCWSHHCYGIVVICWCW